LVYDDFYDRAGVDEPQRQAVDTSGRHQVLHVKIGELTLENDFLESGLDKAGLLSARQ